MRNFIKNSVIVQAIDLGFDFEELATDADFDLNETLENFFLENADKLPVIFDECEVTSHGNSQNVSYGDFSSDGEIVDFSSHWHKPADTKIFHSDFLFEQNGIIKKMKLYYIVGNTEFNQ